jgi:hypothetical protein
MQYIDKNILKQSLVDRKQQDNFQINLFFSATNLQGDIDRPYRVVLSKLTKKSTATLGFTETLFEEDPKFKKPVEIDFSFSKYIRLTADVYSGDECIGSCNFLLHQLINAPSNTLDIDLDSLGIANPGKL